MPGAAQRLIAPCLLWSAAIFVPLQYFTQGSLTSFGYIVAMWFYQGVVNAVPLGCLIVRKDGAESPKSDI